MLYDIFIAPFADFEFMRRALVGVGALALGAAPIGVVLMLRRMSLVGDAMAHAILPGAAIGFLLSGLSLFAMTAGGLIAGFVILVNLSVDLVYGLLNPQIRGRRLATLRTPPAASRRPRS